MRILGLDPGFNRLGYGAIRVIDDEIFLIGHGLIHNPRDPAHSFNEHLNAGIQQITVDMPRLLDIIKPDRICAELVPVGRLSANSELVVAAITTCKVIAFQFGIEWIDYGANTVKKIVTGDGNATKAKVKNAVIAQFPVIGERHNSFKQQQKEAGEKAEGLPQDTFDGCAVALAGAHFYMEQNDRSKNAGVQDMPQEATGNPVLDNERDGGSEQSL